MATAQLRPRHILLSTNTHCAAPLNSHNVSKKKLHFVNTQLLSIVGLPCQLFGHAAVCVCVSVLGVGEGVKEMSGTKG